MHSMTAFARGSIKLEGLEIICEMRSVNHRYLDLNLRLPEAIRHLDSDLRAMIKKRLARGKVDCQFDIQPDVAEAVSMDINTPLVNALFEAAQKVNSITGSPKEINPFHFLKWPGVVHEKLPDAELIAKQCAPLLDDILTQFIDARSREGESLKTVILDKMEAVDAQVEIVANKVPNIIQAQREKLLERCKELAEQIDENRLEQELLFFAQKMDVAEEMDRIRAHLKEVRKNLNDGEIVGRRLDFLMQELNREANTLSSKSVDSTTTQAAVEMKVLVEQMREQAQNIE